MSWCRKTSIRGLLAAVAVTTAWGISGISGVAHGSDGAGGTGGSGGPVGSDLWAAATIEPGREGIVEVGGYEGVPLGEGSVLTLTAPGKAKVTGTPFTALGYRGTVALGGSNGTYTFEGASASTAAEREEAVWKGRTFPFVLSVPPDAEPGTRLPDCALVLKDADGTVRQRGTCTVTVGLPEPTLDGPQSGVPLSASPQTSGTAYPGAQVTVRDALEEEVCSTTTAPDGTWSCTPSHTLPPGPGRLQATATLNGVSATSEQIHITVAGR